MLNAKKVLNVTFDEAAEKIRGHRRSELIVRFRYRNSCDEEVTVKSLKVSALYKDWYGDCDICPANDTYVSRLHILLPTCVALDITEDVPFMLLMDTIEEVTVGHAPAYSRYG